MRGRLQTNHQRSDGSERRMCSLCCDARRADRRGSRGLSVRVRVYEYGAPALPQIHKRRAQSSWVREQPMGSSMVSSPQLAGVRATRPVYGSPCEPKKSRATWHGPRLTSSIRDDEAAAHTFTHFYFQKRGRGMRALCHRRTPARSNVFPNVLPKYDRDVGVEIHPEWRLCSSSVRHTRRVLPLDDLSTFRYSGVSSPPCT